MIAVVDIVCAFTRCSAWVHSSVTAWFTRCAQAVRVLHNGSDAMGSSSGGTLRTIIEKMAGLE
jgi:hypothetical protein